MTAWLMGLWLAIAAPSPAEAPARSAAAAATDHALTELARTANWLAALPEPEEGDWEDGLEPSPLEAELDRTLQRQLGDFVEAWLHQHGAAGSVDRLQDELLAELRRAEVHLAAKHECSEVSAGTAFAGDVKLAVVRPAEDPGLLAVAWETQLSYLGNASLVVFETDGGQVSRVLEWSAALADWPEGDSPGTAPVPFGPTDVLNNFDFRLTPRDGGGRFVVAVVWSEPSPHSSWGTVSWALLASGSHPRSPRVLARGSDGVYQCFDGHCYALTLEDDVVTLDYSGNGGELAVCNGFNASGVSRRWRLVDGKAEELGAPADDPFGFVSDWLDAPWEQARAWSAHGWRLRRWHRLLAQVSCELELVERWTDCERPLRSMVELVLPDGSARDDRDADPTHFFFAIDSASDTPTLRSITTRPPAGDWHELGECVGDEAEAP